MKNNLHFKEPLKQTNVIYEYNCPIEECPLQPKSSYIGCTTTSLSRRLTMHLSDGAIKLHSQSVHDNQLTRNNLTENTNILRTVNDQNRMQITEAILIKIQKPRINRQDTGSVRTLKLFTD